MSGTAYQNIFQNIPEIEKELREAVSAFAVADLERSMRQFQIGRLVLRAWREEFEGEWQKETFYAVMSAKVNDWAGVHLVSASGETLRKWADLTAAFENMPNRELFEQELTFEHFRTAKSLGKDGAIHPAELLAIAYNEELTADELWERYGPKAMPPSEYERVTGWVSSLRGAKFEWLDGAIRQEAAQLLDRLERLLQGNVPEPK